MAIVAIVQARIGSTRLPGKVLRPLGGRSTLGWVVRAAHQSAACERVVVATTDEAADDAVRDEAIVLGAEVTRGSVDDVLGRFLGAGLSDSDAIVRLTADCPLLDPAVIAMAVRAFEPGCVDYLSTVTPRSLPRGLDVEVASVAALRRAAEVATGADRVHVTSYVYRHPEQFRVAGLTFQPDCSQFRVTMDTEDDAELIEKIVAELGDDAPAWRDVVDLLRRRPDLVALNAHVRQKELKEG